MKTIIIVLCLFLFSCGGNESINQYQYWPESCESDTVFIGDSITYWWPPEFLPEGCNYGVPGSMSFDWLNWEPPTTDHTYILLGVNDFREGLSVDAVYKNIMTISEKYEDVTLVSVLPTSRGYDFLNPKITDLNNRLAVSGYKFIDLSYFDPTLTSDGLHPTYEGYESVNDQFQIYNN